MVRLTVVLLALLCVSNVSAFGPLFHTGHALFAGGNGGIPTDTNLQVEALGVGVPAPSSGIECAGDVLPSADGSYDLGSSSKHWAEVRSNYAYAYIYRPKFSSLDWAAQLLANTKKFSFLDKDSIEVASISATGVVTCSAIEADGAAPTLTYGSTHGGPIVLTPSDLTISSGAITVTKGFHRIIAQADTSPNDTLSTISGTFVDGQILILSNADNSNVITVDSADNINPPGGSQTLQNRDKMTLLYNDNIDEWDVLSFSNN